MSQSEYSACFGPAATPLPPSLSSASSYSSQSSPLADFPLRNLVLMTPGRYS